MPDPSREPLQALSATALAQGLRTGIFTAEAVAQSCLARIAAREPAVQAWICLDPDLVLAQARAADRRCAAGVPLGALHGIPVGIKDIIDTADMPTENGTVLHAGRRPAADAALITRLRNAGAIIVGKTGDLRAGQDPQPAPSRTHARRIIQRFRGCGRRRHGAAGGGHPDQRIGDPASGVLRCLRL